MSSQIGYFCVIPACRESFFNQKDSGQARMTEADIQKFFIYELIIND